MIKECLNPNMTTPANTIGMGGVDPLNGDPGVPPQKSKKRKMKSLKDYIRSKSKEKDLNQEY